MQSISAGHGGITRTAILELLAQYGGAEFDAGRALGAKRRATDSMTDADRQLVNHRNLALAALLDALTETAPVMAA